MIIIKKYSRIEEGTPRVIGRFTLEELMKSVQADIDLYKSRLPERKNSKTYKKISSKIMLLEAYKNNINSCKSISDISYVMSTSVHGRYRMEDPNGNLLKIVYENDGRIFWDFENSEISADISEKIVPEQSAWERLKARLDEMNIDEEGFD